MRRSESMLYVIGGALVVVSVVLIIDLGGAGTAVIHRVTSRSLGELAPGFAAGRFGFRIYAGLLGALGLTVLGLAVAQGSPVLGVVVVAAGLIAFVLLSIVAIAGEVRTYRALKR
jgi:hypothetical protein